MFDVVGEIVTVGVRRGTAGRRFGPAAAQTDEGRPGHQNAQHLDQRPPVVHPVTTRRRHALVNTSATL